MSNKKGSDELPKRWSAFLQDLDDVAEGPVELHIVGGFAVTVVYGVARETADLDFIAPTLGAEHVRLLEAGGINAPLHRVHSVYLDPAGGVTDRPVDYATRLRRVAKGRFKNLRLWALDPDDLVLAKLTRNWPKDREDLGAMAEARLVNPEVLRHRYRNELRPYLLTTDGHDTTAKLWVEEAEERRAIGCLRELARAEDVEVGASRAVLREMEAGNAEEDAVSRARSAERRRRALEGQLDQTGKRSSPVLSPRRVRGSAVAGLIDALMRRWMTAHREWKGFRDTQDPAEVLRARAGKGAGAELFASVQAARGDAQDAMHLELRLRLGTKRPGGR